MALPLQVFPLQEPVEVHAVLVICERGSTQVLVKTAVQKTGVQIQRTVPRDQLHNPPPPGDQACWNCVSLFIKEPIYLLLSSTPAKL